MLTSTIITLFFFLIFISLGFPIAYSMIVSGIFYVIFFGGGISDIIIPFMQLKHGVTFSLLAVYLFVFLGNIMNKTAISDYIVATAHKLTPNIPGKTGMITILSCALMGPLTGSANGTTVSIGTIMIPQMKKHGYNENYSTALLAYSGILGALIPPSISGIIYALITRSSVMVVWMSLLGAGLTYLLVLVFAHLLFARIRKYDIEEIGEESNKRTKENYKFYIKALPSILVPLSILGGIYGGVVTATEAGALGSFVVILLGLFVYKSIRSHKDIFSSVYISVNQTANIMFLVCGSFVLSYIITSTSVGMHLGYLAVELISNKTAVLLLTELFLVILGFFMDDNAIIIILAPIAAATLLPIGIHPCHLAGCFVLVGLIGLVTPPVGVVLYSASTVADVRVERFLKEIYLFFIPAIISILLVTFIPGITLFFPKLFHLI